MTRESFLRLRLRRILGERGILLVAMQYPLRDVNQLRLFLEDAEEVVSVFEPIFGGGEAGASRGSAPGP